VKHRAILALFLLTACASQLSAQYQSSFNYTTEDGLISSEIMCVFVDSRGMVWAGSGSGVSSFDGRNFRNYTTDDGLWTNSVSVIFEDAEGSIWFTHSPPREWERKVSVLKPGGTVEILDTRAMTGEKRGQVFWNKYRKKVQFFGNGELWEFDFRTRKFELIAELPCVYNMIGGFSLDPFQDRFIVTDYTGSPGPQRLFLWKGDSLEELPPMPPGYENSMDREASIPGSGEVLLSWRNELWYLDKEKGWQPFIPPKAGIYQPAFSLTDDYVVFSLDGEGAEKGLIEINPSVPHGIAYRFRAPTRISNIVRGKDGAYWAVSRNGLLKIFPAFMDCPIDERSLALSDLHAICEDARGNIWFGSYSFGFSYYDGKEVRSGPDFLKPFYSVLPGSLRDEKGNMYFWLEQSKKPSFPRGLIAFDGLSPPVCLHPDTMGFYFHETFDGQTGIGLCEHGLGIAGDPFTGRIKTFGKEKGFRLTNVQTAVKDHYGGWWMGRASAGLCYYDTKRDTIFNWLRNEQDLSFGVMSSAMDFKGNLWFGASDGLYFFKNRPLTDPAGFPPQKEFKRIGVRELGLTQVNMLKWYDQRTLIAGNLTGIALLDVEAFYKTGKPVIYFFRKEDGYTGPGTEQNCVWIDRDGRVWIGSDAGAHRFDPRLFVRPRPPAFTIDSLVAAGENYPPFSPSEKPVRFSRKVKNQSVQVYLQPESDPVRANHLYFTYKLSPDTAFSTPGQDPRIEFRSLGPGDYSLQIKALKDGMESEIQTVEFRIPPGFWSTAWPYLIATILAGVSFRAFQLNQNRQKMERNKLQVQAIVNQLNPHFINNALQLVQISVFKDENAVGIVSKLGENIRLVFRNSRDKKSFHALSEEMKLVENYLFIQKKRFGSHIEYQLPENGALEAFRDIQVPLMQVQIHCENAVEHGIRNKEVPGRVIIGLMDEGAYLHITVEDDGVGRAKAAAMGSKGTQRGTKMLETLRDIFNRHNSLPLIYYYDDDIFTNEKGEKHGTRVHMRIPKNYRYEFD